MTRTFDEREVALILREATRVEDSAETRGLHPPDVGEGVTLAELKDIASEVGIDPLRVDQAARSLLARQPQSPLQVFLGAPAQIQIHSEIPAELDDADLGEALFEIRALMAAQGRLASSSTAWEWASESELGSRHVTIARTPTGTRVEVSGDFGNAARGAAAVAATVAGVGAVGVAAAVAAVGTAGWLVAPISAAGALILPRLTAGRAVAREARRLSRVADRLRTLFAPESRAP